MRLLHFPAALNVCPVLALTLKGQETPLASRVPDIRQLTDVLHCNWQHSLSCGWQHHQRHSLSRSCV
jgi:hypothetical protein